MISFEFPMISHIGVGCPTNPTPLVRNPPWLLHAHFSTSISSKHALDDVSWCVFGVVFAVVGFIVGLAVGSLVGFIVGFAVGFAVGLIVGLAVGSLVGKAVGVTLGELVGDLVGAAVGLHALQSDGHADRSPASAAH